jgi:hypothetical protein
VIGANDPLTSGPGGCIQARQLPFGVVPQRRPGPAPAGWRVGLVRIRYVAIGCAVSFVIGTLFWPRGAGPLVGNDLADAFRRGAAYLTQAVDWTLGLRPDPAHTAIAAVTAGIRLDDALRGYLAGRGANCTRPVPRKQCGRGSQAWVWVERQSAGPVQALAGWCPLSHRRSRLGQAVLRRLA